MAQSIRPLGDYVDLLEQRGLLTSRPAGLDLTAPVALVSYDSRQVEPGTLFVCKGAHFKAEFLQMARDKGAMAYVSLEPYPQVDLPCIQVTDMRETIAPLADLYYGHPSGDLNVIGQVCLFLASPGGKYITGETISLQGGSGMRP